LKDAGVDKETAEDTIDASEKSQLLMSLRQSQGVEKKTAGASKITLTRKKRGEIKVSGPGRKAVTVETRGKRTYAKRDDSAREEMIRQAAARQQQADPTAKEEPSPEPVSTEEAAAAAAREKELEAERIRQEAEQAVISEADRAKAEEDRIKAEEEAEEAARVAEIQAREDAEKARIAAEEAARDAAAAAAMAELTQSVEEAGKARERAVQAAAEAENIRKQEAARRSAGANSGASGRLGEKKPGRGAPVNLPPAEGGKRKELRVTGGRGGRREKRSRRETYVNPEAKHGFAKPTAPVIHDVEVPETITVAELGNRMAVKAGEVIKTMMGMGVMATINQVLDQDTAVLVVEEMGHNATTTSADDLELELQQRLMAAAETEDDSEELATRPPVVTVMGHVDHGKTSLLDYIRSSRVAAGESGGITQHIGAYSVQHDKGAITFLDTPGHAAFSSMRARGAQATDLVVLVVAADDGAMPQTVEAVQHSRAAGVPIIVAVNKMDKEGADPEKVKNDLSQHEVISEEWGGDVMFVPVSALTGQGIDDLLDALLLQAELLDLNARSEGQAQGVVIEATLDKGRGPVATVLVQAGQLKRGDIMVTGKEFGRVRAMFNDKGEPVETAGPSMPVQVLGLSNTPDAGEEMLVSKDERGARELADLRNEKSRDARLAERKPAKLEDVFSQVKSGDHNTLNLVVKTDVQGSFEALRNALEDFTTDEVFIRVIGGGVGGITESDAQLAAASSAVMIGFNVRADNAARRVISEQDIELHYDSVIYEVLDRVKAAAGLMLAPDIVENIIGLAEVQDVFRSPKFGHVAGCMVADGVVRRDEPIRVLRDNIVIFEGELESLRRFKDDVNEVRMGTECGIGVKNYTDIKAGDQIEVFERKEVARTL